jgi:O-antigen/teichoic acid export membrane protein
VTFHARKSFFAICLKSYTFEIHFQSKFGTIKLGIEGQNMSVLQKQAFQNALLLYTGVFLGAMNKYLLFSRILGGEKMGLVDVILSSALVLAEVSKLGSTTTLIRFFPYFTKHREKQASFHFLNLLFYPFLGFLALSLLILIGKTEFLALFKAKSPLFVEYYYFVFPLFLGYALFSSFFSYSQSNLKTVVPVAVQEIGVRLWQAMAVIGFYFHFFTFPQFLLLYSLTYWVNGAVIVVYLSWLKRLNIAVNFSLHGTRLNKIMMRFGFVAFLSRAAEAIKENTSTIQIAKLAGLNATAIYGLGAFVALMIYIPARAMGNIALPIIIQKIQQKKFQELSDIYQKSALNGLIMGLLAFVLIVLNIDYLIDFLPKNRFQHLEDIKYVTLFLSLSRIFDVANGVNAAIVAYSKRTYHYAFYANVVLIAMIFIFNSLFVSTLGVIGASMATALAMFFYNLLNTFIVWREYKMQPFSIQSLYPFALVGGILLLHFFVPTFESIWLNIFIRSGVAILLYCYLILYFKISADFDGIWRKVKGFLQKK